MIGHWTCFTTALWARPQVRVAALTLYYHDNGADSTVWSRRFLDAKLYVSGLLGQQKAECSMNLIDRIDFAAAS